MSTMETPPPDATVPPAPPERRCPRCGSTLAADQEWCLSCGAAAGTEVVEAKGWRVPLYLGGGLAALAVIGVILAIVALASQKEEVPPNASATPSAAPPAATPSALPTLTPAPTHGPEPERDADAGPERPQRDAHAGADHDPDPERGAHDRSRARARSPAGRRRRRTIIIESARRRRRREGRAAGAGRRRDVGVLNSDDYSSLNGGYWVVFSGEYTSKSDAEDALDGVRANHSDAYVRQVKQ